MTDAPSLPRSSTALFALGGPVLAGAVLSLPFGARRVLCGAAALPLVLVGVAILTVPALYIGASMLGAAPSSGAVVRGVIRGLRAAGILLLGMVPPSAFLLATARGDLGTRLLTVLVVGAAALAALRVLHADLFSDGNRSRRALPLFLAWSAVSLAIGSHFLATAFHF